MDEHKLKQSPMSNFVGQQLIVSCLQRNCLKIAVGSTGRCAHSWCPQHFVIFQCITELQLHFYFKPLHVKTNNHK